MLAVHVTAHKVVAALQVGPASDNRLVAIQFGYQGGAAFLSAFAIYRLEAAAGEGAGLCRSSINVRSQVGCITPTRYG